jgi:hypothetical protein
MSAARVASLGLLVWLSVLLGAGQARADFLIQPAVHGSLVDVGQGMAGGLELGSSLAWLPIPEVGVGIDLGMLVPFQPGGQTAADSQPKSELVLQAYPVAWLRFGRDEAWGFVRAGLGIAGHLRDGALDPVMVGLLAGGFVVAPRQLPFHFGFELAGQWELYDAPTTRSIGLGAFVGWVL